MKISYAKISALLLITSLYACTSKEGKNEGFEEVPGGNFFKEVRNGNDTSKPRTGDVVFMMLNMKNDKDSVIYSSTQNQNGFDAIRMGEPIYEGDFFQLLQKVNVGDSVLLKIRANDYYKAQKTMCPPFIDSLSFICFEIRLDSMIPSAEIEKRQQAKMAEYQKKMEEARVAEPEYIKKYLADNSLSNAKALESGLYYIEKVKGKGKKPVAGDSIEVAYTGKFLDGKVFDSSEGRPEPFRFRVGLNQVIPAWEETLLKMNVGTKALIVAPSVICYGAMGSGPIPPYSPLVFEMELLDIKSSAKK